MRDFHVACGQFAAEPGDKDANIARMVGQAREARQAGSDLILFPELILTGYLAPEQIRPLAEPADGPSVRALAKAACDLGIGIAFGLAELDERRKVRHNSLAFLDKGGRLVRVYRKTHLWGDEKTWAEPGADVPAFGMEGICVSGWICFDTRFPEVARLAALGGAELGLVSTAWLGPGDEWKLAMQARALDNAMFVAGADIINPDPGLRCLGLSLIVGPKGHILAQAEPGQEGIIHAVLRKQDLEAQRDRVALLESRRPELYGRLSS